MIDFKWLNASFTVG